MVERGPHSRKRSWPCSLRCAMALANCTVARAWPAQYAGSVACWAVMGRPVTVETMGICGAWSGMAAMAWRSGSTMGSIMAEWKACEVWRKRQTTCSASRRDWKARISGSGPETTQRLGALLEAIWSVGGRRDAMASMPRLTAIMEPRGRLCMRRPRRATMARTSSSCQTPASVAATNSPMLWPAMMAGWTPKLCQRRASAYSTTKIAGWV